MKAKAVYILTVVLFAAGILFFLKGFFLSRVELPTRSDDFLDITGAFSGQDQAHDRAQYYLSKSVLDLGRSLSHDQKSSQQEPYFTLFNANYKDPQQKDKSTISPITLLSTLHSMPTTISQLFTTSTTQSPNHPDTVVQENDQQTCSWFCRQYDQIFFLVIDALRFDFLQFNQTLSSFDSPPPEITMEHPPYLNRLPALSKYHQTHPTSSGFYKFRADTPTVTMQRLKAMMTGSLPTFLDVKDNFAATMIQEDNLFLQVSNKKHNTIMVGDDTWMGLVGELLTRAYPYPSFDVHDLDTVDNGCIYRIHHELCGRTLAAMQLGLGQYLEQLKIVLSQNNSDNTQTQFTSNDINNLLKLVNELDLVYETDTQYSEEDKARRATLGSLGLEGFKPNVDYTKSNILPTWFIAHFLGVDHVGHRFGPRHPLMNGKLLQMNDLLQKFLDYVDVYGDFSEKQSKTFHETLTQQFDFVNQYCDEKITTQFGTKWDQIDGLLKKTTGDMAKVNAKQLAQVDPTKFNTQTPSSRTVVYVMGDHGMTEGGNHGGASSKETQAGFAVMSTLTLDSPSSFIKHHLLHQHGGDGDEQSNNQRDEEEKLSRFAQFGSPREMIKHKYNAVEDIFNVIAKTIGTTNNNKNHKNIDLIMSHHPSLPSLSLIYDYSHIKNYDDVYTQTHVQTPDDEAFSMGQIDSLPTLSLIAGVPIPYGNLGVLKKELIPNQFLHTHKDQLSGTYGNEWNKKETICSLFSTFEHGLAVPGSNNHGSVDIKIAEMRHEIMILHLRMLNLGQMLRYANDYTKTVKTFSGLFVQDAIVHSKVILAKLGLIEESLNTLSTSCQSDNTPLTIDQLAHLMNHLYMAIIDTNQHMHLIMTHVKAGFTREWTQFDMACMYAALISLLMLTIILGVQVVKFIYQTRQGDEINNDKVGTQWYNANCKETGHKYQENNLKDDNCIIKFILSTSSVDISDVFPLAKELITTTGIITLVVGILPTLLWLCRSTWTELHIPIPKFLILLNEYTANAATIDENALDLAQAVTTTETRRNDLYTIHILTFYVAIFALIFFTRLALYFIARLIVTYKALCDIVIESMVKVNDNELSQQTGVSKLPVEVKTRFKFAIALLCLLCIVQGFCSNSYIDNESIIVHVLCTMLALYVFWALFSSYMYYYPAVVGDKKKQNGIVNTDTSVGDDSNDDDLDIDESSALISSPRGRDNVKSSSRRDASRTRRRNDDSDEDTDESSDSADEVDDGMTEMITIGRVSSRGTKPAPPTASLPPLDILIGKKGKKAPIRALSPRKFAFFALLSFLLIACMRIEVELAHTNSKLMFSVPYSEHTSFVSWVQDLMYGGDALAPLMMPIENPLLTFTQIHVNTKTDMVGATPDMIAKPVLIDAIIHRLDGDNHNHDEISEKLHQHQHQHDGEETNNDGKNRVVEPSQAALEKTDPVQLLKTALNMFSPDIALDGFYVRKQDRILAYIEDSQTKTVVPSSGQLYSQDEFDEMMKNGQEVIMNKVLGEWVKNYASAEQKEIAQGTNNKYVLKTISSQLFDIAPDTRSHYSAIHIIIIFAVFITGLIILQRYMMSKYSGPNFEEFSQFLHKTAQYHNNIQSYPLGSFTFHLPSMIRTYTSYFVPTTAFYVSCYWIPSYIATIGEPVLSLALIITGACNNLAQDKPSFLTFSDQVQLCSSSRALRPLIVQFLRAYIPICVYVIGIAGLVLFICFIVQLIKINRLSKSHTLLVKTPTSNKPTLLIPFDLMQYYNQQHLLSFIFIVLFPTVCLVSGARSTMTYSLFIMLLEISKRLIISLFSVVPYSKQLVHLCNIIALYVFLITSMFHSTGHAYSFNDIHIASGFVGVPGYIFGISEVLVFLNTFGGYIFGTFATLQLGLFTTSAYSCYRNQVNNAEGDEQYKEKNQADTTTTPCINSANDQLADTTSTSHFLLFSTYIPIAWILFWVGLRLLVCTLNVHVQRRDLFVWPLYAPYWLIVAIVSILTYAMVIIYSFSLEDEVKVE